MNTCTFCGRIVADAELKTTTNGTSVCNVRVASDTGWGDNVKTHWLDCAIFGKRGESLQPHLTKGSPVTVVGDLEPPRTYEANNGETRVAQSLVVREIALQGASKDDTGQHSAQGAGTPQRGSQGASRTSQGGGSGGGGGGQPFEPDSEIPF